MEFDFQQAINRYHTGSVKFDCAAKFGKPEGLLPLWVADMDFPCAPAILSALQKRLSHGIFGYSEAEEGYWEAVQGWFSRRHGWHTEESWLVKTPGVVFAIAAAIRALTKEGESILIQQPVYYPFASIAEKNNRRLTVNELVYQDGRYQIDFEDFETKIQKQQVKVFLLSNPQNPVGRVWTSEELKTLWEICRKHHVFVISDEIHCDFIYPRHTHHVFVKENPDALEWTITCTSPSKTFNLAGLQTSNIFIANPKIKKAFIEEYQKTGYDELNPFGLTACQAAYAYGEAWFESLMQYLTKQVYYVKTLLAERFPKITLVMPEGTYLLWLDFQKLGLSAQELDNFLVKKAGLWLDDGAMFGPSGRGFARVNIACPRSTLEEAFRRLKKAMEEIQMPL